MGWREGGQCWEDWGTIQEQVLEVAGLVRLRMGLEASGCGGGGGHGAAP